MKEKRISLLIEKLERYECALKEIATYSAREKGENEYTKHLREVESGIHACEECARVKANKYISCGLCDKHYSAYYEARRRVDLEYEYQQKWEPTNIARRALEEN